MLDPENIRNIVASGEGYNAEFKVRIPNKVKELSEEICAFLNAAGGTLLIGVDDANAIRGIRLSNGKRSAIQNSLNEITPKFSCGFYTVEVDGKEVGVVDVPSGPNKPYVLSGAIYVRIGPNTQKLTAAEEMRDFFQQADRIYFDEAPCTGFDPGRDVDPENLREFRVAAGLSPAIPDGQIFENLRLFSTDGPFKNGAVLFFGTSPEAWFEKAVVRCIAFDGTDKRYVTDDKIFTGPLFRQYRQASGWLKGKLNVRYDIEEGDEGQRKEHWEIPFPVFREAIVNALSHRDYYDKGGRITIEVYDDRVEISNPGGLVSAIKPREFGRRSHSRNPLVFGLFERMRMVEQIGSGIGRMQTLMTEAGLPHPEFHHDGIFTVTLSRPVNFDRWIASWSSHLTEKRIAILKAIRERPGISKRELEEVAELSATAIDNNLNFLKDKGLLERVGTKGGKWVLHMIDPEEE